MGEYRSAPPNILGRKGSSKLVKHEDLAMEEGRDGGMRDISSYHDHDGDEYDSASSDEGGEVPISTQAHGAHSSAFSHAVGNTAQQPYGSVIHSTSINHASLEPGQNRNGPSTLDNGHRRNSYNDLSSGHHALSSETSSRKMSFSNGNGGGNGAVGMSLMAVQDSQALHQNGISAHPYQQYPAHPHSSQQPLGNVYSSGSHTAQSGQMGPPDHVQQNQLQPADAQRSQHADSSVRFVPGFLNAVHSDTPTPSPPNGYRQGNGSHQRNAHQDSSQPVRSQHATMPHSISTSGPSLSPLNPASALARARSEHGPRNESVPPIIDNGQSSSNHPLSFAHAASHGMVSSGYNISLSAPNGTQDGSMSNLGQLYDTSQIQPNSGRAAPGSNMWSATSLARDAATKLQQAEHQGSSLSAGYDQSTGLVRRDYAGHDTRASVVSETIRVEDDHGIGGEDAGKDVGPGVGSSHSGGTSASLKALKMDLGEEGNDAANE